MNEGMTGVSQGHSPCHMLWGGFGAPESTRIDVRYQELGKSTEPLLLESLQGLASIVRERFKQAETAEDLTRIVEENIDDDALQKKIAEISYMASSDYFDELSKDTDAVRHWLDVVDEPNHGLVRAVDGLVTEHTKAAAQYFRWLESEPTIKNVIDVLISANSQKDPIWYTTDHSIPIGVRKSLLAKVRSEVLLYGVGLLEVSSVGSDVKRLLLKLLVTNLYEHLRLVAILPGVSVGYDVLPENERMNIELEVAKHRQAEAAYRKRLSYAQQHGGAVNFNAKNRV